MSDASVSGGARESGGLAKGTLIGPYEILEKIGEGGMGVVYRARDTRLGRGVAVKMLPVDLRTDADRLKRFETETRAASSLNHPNILTIHDVGSHEGAPFVVSELLEGATLRHELASRRLSPERVVDFGTQIAQGLAAAHEKSIVHRDLKPENLFVSPHGHVKILDFGLAKLIRPEPEPGSATSVPTQTQATEAGVVMGTVGYMSPEQVRGEPVDHRSDLFSFGVILYEMLSGQHAFQRGSVAETMSAILRDDPPGLGAGAPAVSGSFERVVRHCLEKDPKARFQSARDVAFALKEAAAGREAPGLASAVVAAPAAVAAPAEPVRQTRLRLWLGMGVAAALAAALFVDGGRIVRRIVRGGASPGKIQSLAVLPLDNFSKDPEQDYFADGMTEALTNDLAQIGSLRVISRNSVLDYKGTRKKVSQIGSELDVDGVLEGSVQRAGGRVRISTELVEAATDRHLWAKSYEGDAKDVLSLQSQVARAVADAVKATLSPAERARLAQAPTVNPEAHDLVLKGAYELGNASDEAGVARAEEYFDRALDKDPTYALAYAAKAWVYVSLNDVHQAPTSTMPKARAAAERALELDPNQVDAHVALARVSLLYDWDFAAGEREARRALEIQPNSADAHHMLGWYFQFTGRREESLAEFEKAEKLNPLDAEPYATTAFGEYMARRWEPAVASARKGLKLVPESGWLREIAALSLVRLGRCGEAVATAKEGAEKSHSPMVLATSGGVYATCGQPDAARAVLAKLDEIVKTQYVCPYEVGVIHVGLSEKDEAFRWFDKGVESRSACMPYAHVDPRLDPIRSDPRCARLLRRIGLAAAGAPSPQTWLAPGPPALTDGLAIVPAAFAGGPCPGPIRR
ncbi:MAG TPA: protein kinase [Thermoanaerobaculia bacterium]|nr:protein kinase [Thermoanaerobaculia bacterium]